MLELRISLVAVDTDPRRVIVSDSSEDLEGLGLLGAVRESVTIVDSSTIEKVDTRGDCVG